MEVFYNQINFLEQTKGNLISERQAFVEGELGELQNDYVVPEGLPAENYHFITEVYERLLAEEFDVLSENYNELLAVANQCPAAGGQSVYRARAMLALINDSLAYNDNLSCLQSGIYREIVADNNNFNIEIIPNPASDLITVKVMNPKEGFCNLTIHNTLGAIVSSSIFNCEISEHFINVEKLTIGIYFVHVNFEGNYRNTQKLIIIK
jgi:hypothetical protein